MNENLVSNNILQEILSRLDKIFMECGVIIPVDYDIVKNIPYEELRLYCHFRGIYAVITSELCDWFLRNVNLRDSIEIGAGNGTLGRDLGIRLTDNYNQTRNDVKSFYIAIGQPVIKYPRDVQKIDAIKAVRKYQPRVVIGSWITRKFNPNEPEKGGNMYGVDEVKLVKNCEVYYHVCNLSSDLHKKSDLLNNPEISVKIHRNIPFFSRNENHKDNVVLECRYNKHAYENK